MATYEITNGIPSSIQTGDILTCEYSGASKQLTLPKGIYIFECYGAQGGTFRNATGGLGGYAKGKIEITSATTVELIVGGTTDNESGGYNHGGNGVEFSTGNGGYGGGGSTEIYRMVHKLQREPQDMGAKLAVAQTEEVLILLEVAVAVVVTTAVAAAVIIVVAAVRLLCLPVEAVLDIFLRNLPKLQIQTVPVAAMDIFALQLRK